ncbi:MAG: ribosome-binding factor A [Candidatus Staskawiczbacteria bacterium RIFCSPLOWO2_01_FULL_38_12b]|uniref:Ribosome-binding factor A n=1 Tax=Candidatus Staskawiczbacteria bacterium RIFCSPLOWO2_01_FULL_38_12b TaxID=1802214 RepID=A0A1G2ID63_9BACT|nr:MAG: ribosome-binding factor A [Candidatus Staskawiczbacteria bacterium RIFCSPLOWO2_01_FULL_38_12b]
MSNRLEKVNSLLQQEISKIIVRDFDFHGALITLTHVDASANLIEARAYVSVMPEDRIDQAVKALNKDVYDIQQKLNKILNMRPVPRIKFVKDPVIAEAARIEGLLESLKKEEK